MFQFTSEIWKALRENAQERAKYLKDIFSECVQNFAPTLYLDVGTGLGYNALIFGENSKEILAMDLRFPKNSVLRNKDKISLIVADAQFLPLKEEVFDLVSLFSVIEHVGEQELALTEALRVLKSKGKLTVQIPNRYFPLEVHSGLPFVFMIPSRIRHFIFRKIGYEWLNSIDIPSKTKLECTISRMNTRSKIAAKKVIYPSSLMWPRLQALYKFLQKVHFLDFLPLGYLFVVEK